ncbi:MAG: glycoside hydrolase family 26 protein [Chloroflexota bacterium]
MKARQVFAILIIAAMTLGAWSRPAVSAPQVFTAQAPLAVQSLGITHGVHLPPVEQYGTALQAYNKLAGKDAGILMYFMNWNTRGFNGSAIDAYLMNKIRETFGSSGPAIMLSWQPQAGSSPGCTREYSGRIPLGDITAGVCDEYIRRFAQALDARPERILLRFAHEMNINGVDWAPATQGIQDAGAYVRMWRHVHDVFATQNVDNVEWVWSPNYWSNPPSAWNDRDQYYPGDAYVDWVAVDGYNYYTNLSSPWRTFDQIYDSSEFRYVLKDLACKYAKPQILAEFGTVNGGAAPTNKSTWITEAYQSMPDFPFLRAVVYFNDFASADPSRADFRVTAMDRPNSLVSALPATTAYKQALSSSSFNSVLPSLAEATPPTTYCEGQSSYAITPQQASLPAVSGVSQHTLTVMTSESVHLTVSVPEDSGLTAELSSHTVTPPWGTITLTIGLSDTTLCGMYDVVVQGGGVDQVIVQVSVQPSLQLDQSSGQVTSVIAVQGTHFSSSAALDVTVNNILLIQGTPQFSSSGGAVAFDVGSTDAEPGYYQIEISDSGGACKARAGFTLTRDGTVWPGGTPAFDLPPNSGWSLIYLPLLRK